MYTGSKIHDGNNVIMKEQYVNTVGAGDLNECLSTLNDQLDRRYVHESHPLFNLRKLTLEEVI